MCDQFIRVLLKSEPKRKWAVSIPKETLMVQSPTMEVQLSTSKCRCHKASMAKWVKAGILIMPLEFTQLTSLTMLPKPIRSKPLSRILMTRLLLSSWAVKTQNSRRSKLKETWWQASSTQSIWSVTRHSIASLRILRRTSTLFCRFYTILPTRWWFSSPISSWCWRSSTQSITVSPTQCTCARIWPFKSTWIQPVDKEQPPPPKLPCSNSRRTSVSSSWATCLETTVRSSRSLQTRDSTSVS